MPEKVPRDNQELNIDVTQLAGTEKGSEKWQKFAMSHLKEMRVLKEAGLLGKENKDWRNVSEHVMVVSALAGFLAKRAELDCQEVEAAAILHDASKRLDVESGVRYDKERKSGHLQEILNNSGYFREFVDMASYSGRVPEIFIEDKEEQKSAVKNISLGKLIVAYSDARTRNVDIVSLEEARDGNKRKNPKDSEFYDKWYEYYKTVEETIFEKVKDVKPSDVDNEIVAQSLS